MKLEAGSWKLEADSRGIRKAGKKVKAVTLVML
jgi:hypothetical protein